MIRRDYIMRQIQEMVQILARAVFLRTRGECEVALQEIRKALKGLDPNANEESLDPQGWIDLCRRHDEAGGSLLEVVGSLLRERAASLQASGNDKESEKARAAGLTLHLEAILSADNPLTTELLDQVDEAIGAVSIETLPPATLSRLFAYCEQRGRLAAAEDILFDWVERGDPNAVEVGRAFYGRLAATSDQALVEGGLERGEIEDGQRALEERARNYLRG
jgi:hypothetical protein